MSVLEVISVGHELYKGDEGGVDWESGSASYPDVRLIDVPLTEFTTEAARFHHYNHALGYYDIDTLFVARGKMGWLEYEGQWVWVMSDIRLELESTTSYYLSSLTFRARASNSFLGKPDDPIIEFNCHGEFDPFGGWSCSFKADLQIDGWGHVKTVRLPTVTEGIGDVHVRENQGFSLAIQRNPDRERAEAEEREERVATAYESVSDTVSDAYERVSDTVSGWFADDQEGEPQGSGRGW